MKKADGPKLTHSTEPLPFMKPTLHTHQTKLTVMMSLGHGTLQMWTPTLTFFSFST